MSDVRFIYGVIPASADWFGLANRRARPWEYPDLNPMPKVDFTPITLLRTEACRRLIRLADLVERKGNDLAGRLDDLATWVEP